MSIFLQELHTLREGTTPATAFAVLQRRDARGETPAGLIAPLQGGGVGYQPGWTDAICCWFLHGPGKKGVPAGVVYKVTIGMFPNVPKGNIVGDFAPTDYERVCVPLTATATFTAKLTATAKLQPRSRPQPRLQPR